MAKATPTPERVTVSYGASVTANLGNYESYKTTVNLGEEYSVDGLSKKDIDKLVADRRVALKAQVDEIVEAEYAANSTYAKKSKR